MDVRIGVLHTGKELEIELAEDADIAGLTTDVETALGDDNSILWLTDRRGRRVGIPSSKIAYIEVGSPNDERRVGFGAN